MDRFLALVQKYLAAVGDECRAIPAALEKFQTALAAAREKLDSFTSALKKSRTVDEAGKEPVTDALAELGEAVAAYEPDRKSLLVGLAKFAKGQDSKPPATTRPQHTARQAFDPLAERIKGLIKQIDLLYKLADRVNDQIGKVFSHIPNEAKDGLLYDRRGVGRMIKQLDDDRKEAVEQLRQASYFHRQVAWLLDRFPEGKLADVPGLVKLVSRTDIAAAEWSLTPGRYVGVAPAEVDEDFDFEQTMRDIHVELADLNQEAIEVAAKIQKNFEEMAI
jgi:type I restriction enzyme M protein